MRSEADGRLVGSGWIISWKNKGEKIIFKGQIRLRCESKGALSHLWIEIRIMFVVESNIFMYWLILFSRLVVGVVTLQKKKWVKKLKKMHISTWPERMDLPAGVNNSKNNACVQPGSDREHSKAVTTTSSLTNTNRKIGWRLLTVTLSRPRNSGESTCGMAGSLPRLISCHFSPLVGRGSAPEALTTVRAKAKMSAFVKLL